jgi:ABC-type proline/glycine betaine transport system ATPase subunit
VICSLRGAGVTIMLTTHYMDEAQALADRVAVMAGGTGPRWRSRWSSARPASALSASR